MKFYIENQNGSEIPKSMYAPNQKLDVLEHGWGTSAKQKQKEYNKFIKSELDGFFE